VEDFVIRLATRADEPGIQNVIRTVYEEYGWPWFPDDYHRDLYNIEAAYFNKGGYFWIAEIAGQVVGTTGLEVFDPFPGEFGIAVIDGVKRGAGCDCSLERLYLLGTARGKGIGRKLLQHTIDHAKTMSRKRLEIWSDKKLTQAHRLYEKFGAVPIGDRLCHDPDQSPEWGLTIDLK
jgi:GNAT superfamily N-acetyltransferase